MCAGVARYEFQTALGLPAEVPALRAFCKGEG
nr:MAG TPA: hypothetical protein [Caudoviricetes sp.]